MTSARGGTIMHFDMVLHIPVNLPTTTNTAGTADDTHNTASSSSDDQGEYYSDNSAHQRHTQKTPHGGTTHAKRQPRGQSQQHGSTPAPPSTVRRRWGVGRRPAPVGAGAPSLHGAAGPQPQQKAEGNTQAGATATTQGNDTHTTRKTPRTTRKTPPQTTKTTKRKTTCIDASVGVQLQGGLCGAAEEVRVALVAVPDSWKVALLKFWDDPYMHAETQVCGCVLCVWCVSMMRMVCFYDVSVYVYCATVMWRMYHHHQHKHKHKHHQPHYNHPPPRHKLCCHSHCCVGAPLMHGGGCCHCMGCLVLWDWCPPRVGVGV